MKKQLRYVGGSKQIRTHTNNHDFSATEINKIKTNNLNRLIKAERK